MLANRWHQDVKPANILVFSGNSSSPYDCQFKIADLGLSHFKPTISQATDASDLDAFGTRAYGNGNLRFALSKSTNKCLGAPETFRSHKDIDSTPLPVTQDVDVWSLGCVFSETSVWAHYGWKRVAEYRRRRSQEIEDSGGGEGEHIFHFDGKLLDAVHDVHRDILSKIQVSDRVTRSILHGLVDDMLQHGSRPAAKQCYEKSKRLIKEAETTFGVSVDEFVGNTNYEGTKGSPYIPGKHRRSRVDQQLPLREPLPPHNDPAQSSSSSASQSSTHRHHHKSTSQGSRHVPGNHHRSRADREIPPGEPLPPDSDSAQSSSSSASQSPTPRHHHKSTSQSSRPRSVGPTESSQSGGQVLNVEPFPITASKATNVQDTSPQQPIHPPPEEPVRPTLSIAEGEEWKRKKKAGEFVSLHGEENLTYLDQRDHVSHEVLRLKLTDTWFQIFLIDNSASMKQYSKEVKRVIDLLAYMLKSSDKDGLDIYFTQSVKKVNSQKSSKLSASIQQERFRGVTDMRGRLQSLCQEHINKFGTFITPSRSFFGRQPASQPQRPLSFYILTDAKWQPTDVGAFIKKDLVPTMIAKRCPKEHVAIQFIRFGDDQASINKLDELDHGLGLKAQGM